MENITILEALRMAMTASKNYTDENAVVFERDDISIPGIIDTQYPSLETDDDTLIGAINELHAEIMNGIGGSDVTVGIEEEELDALIYELYGIDQDGK